MKKEKIKDQLEQIYIELAYIRGMLENVSNQMQELREATGISSNENEKLPVRELYVHPWYKYKREKLIASGNYTEPEAREYSVTVKAGYGVSGAATTTQC